MGGGRSMRRTQHVGGQVRGGELQSESQQLQASHGVRRGARKAGAGTRRQRRRSEHCQEASGKQAVGPGQGAPWPMQLGLYDVVRGSACNLNNIPAGAEAASDRGQRAPTCVGETGRWPWPKVRAEALHLEEREEVRGACTWRNYFFR